MNLLETTQLNNEDISIWSATHVAIRSVLSLILKNYAQLLENKFVVPSIVWEKFDHAKVVWAVDANNTILGGICFVIEDELDIASILLVFKEGSRYTKEIHDVCMKHFRVIAKDERMTVAIQCVHIDNHEDIELAKHVNLSPSYYFLSQPLVDDDQV
jgi:hypothetical protein